MHLGGGDRGGRGSPVRDRRDVGRAHDPQHPLHGHDRAARLRIPAALLQPSGRDRGRSGHRVQQGRARRPRLRLRHLRDELRPAHRGRRSLHPRLGSEPLGLRSAHARALAARGPRGRSDDDRGRPDPDGHGRGGGPAPAAFPRQRRSARLRADARARTRRAARRAPARRPRRRLGRARPTALAVHAHLGRGGHGRTRRARRGGRAGLRRGPVAALDRARAAAAADGGQRDARGRRSAGGERQPRQARRGIPLPERRLSRHRRRLPRRLAARVGPTGARQPDGSRRRARGPLPSAGARVLEHQSGGLEPAAGSAQARARERGALHRRPRRVPDRHDRLRGRRASRGELPRVRRPRRAATSTRRSRPR